MFSKLVRPFASALIFAALSFVVIAYQNCAKPLEEIGMNSSLSSNCTVSVSPKSATVGQTVNINYLYTTPGAIIKVVVINNTTGIASETTTHTGNGSRAFLALEAGSYTAYGAVEAHGVSFRNCLDNFSVTNPADYTYEWQIGNWGNCSATACGTTGTRTRSVVCKRNDGQTVADSNCPGTKPATSESCSAQSCDTNYTYSWQIGNWSSCNATTCGASGTQTRTVTCKRSDGQTVADSFCGTKPATSQSCTGACTYTWAYGNWGPCSVTCGYGTQYRSVYCRNNAGQTVADSFCPAASRPAGSQSCYAGVPCGGGSGGGGVGGGGGPGGSGGPIVIK